MDGAIQAGEPLYLSREEAAELHKVSLPTVDRWIKSGGDAFIAEHGGNGRPYKIDADRLKAWRECRLAEEAAAQTKRHALLQQHELALIGGATGPGAADGSASTGGLSADQRIKLWQEQLLQNKLRRERGELVEADQAERAYEERMKLIVDFLRGLPDVLARRLAWDAATTEICAEVVEGIQENLARMLMEESLLD